MRDSKFSAKVGIVNVHPFKKKHRTVYNNEHLSDSYGCPPSHILSGFINKRIEKMDFLDTEIQAIDGCSSANCLYNIYSIKKMRIRFQKAVLSF